MRNLTKALALLLSLVMILTIPVGASAAEITNPSANGLIDEDKVGSITIYKYDLSSAERDGVWDSSYVSTGRYDENGVNSILGSSKESSLGNGEVSYGYAIKGVQFSYLRIADIVQFSEPAVDDSASNHVEILYGIDKVKGADFLKALSLDNGANRYADADHLDSTKYYYSSDVLIEALAAKLKSNSAAVKDALETYITENGGAAMDLTDSYGKTAATNLELGLYLLVETKVPEMVVSTTDPFLVSVPMTTVNGTNADDGGERWLYNITLYPKNLAGIPSLEKTLRENIYDTGKNKGSASDINDGYAHTGTASDGDVIDYQVISTLPTITSESTYLTCYTFIDTLSKGLTYNKNDVVLEFFKDAACTDLIATWKESGNKFTVTYSTATAGESVMTIEMTEQGLFEINTSRNVYTATDMANIGYSGCTLRITYQATMNTDESVVCGDSGNPNDVVLLWKRTSTNYYDTLVDDAHLYTYGIELTKLFSDGKGNLSNVEFTVQNSTDNYYVVAKLDAKTGAYYVTGFTSDSAAATRFVPIASGENSGKVVIKGLEDDLYVITETKTDNGYTLLKESVAIQLSQTESSVLCDVYESDILGLIQNDPRYAAVIVDAGNLHNIPQKQLKHHLLTASATVDKNAVNMVNDKSSGNALAPLKVINTKGFDLPATGDRGIWMFGLLGALLIIVSLASLYAANHKKK